MFGNEKNFDYIKKNMLFIGRKCKILVKFIRTKINLKI